MKGERVQDYDYETRAYPRMKPGQYGIRFGAWYGCTPNGHACNLSQHTVSEHEDGTITVHPSIKVSNQDGELWHGFLEHGVWRSC